MTKILLIIGNVKCNSFLWHASRADQQSEEHKIKETGIEREEEVSAKIKSNNQMFKGAGRTYEEYSK